MLLPNLNMQQNATHAAPRNTPMPMFSAMVILHTPSMQNNHSFRTKHVAVSVSGQKPTQHQVNTGFLPLTISSRSTITFFWFPSMSSFAA